jgi:hypothetical protein
MGAGIAAILAYILRENEKLSSSTCLAFGPGMHHGAQATSLPLFTDLGIAFLT